MHFNNMKSFSCSFSYIIIAMVIKNTVAIAPKPERILVNKCCSDDKRLNGQECVVYGSGDGASDAWWPLIYQVKKDAYFKPSGKAPRFVKTREFQPSCEKPEYLIGSLKMVLFTDGSLYLPGKHKHIKQDNYCIDNGVAIICDPDLNAPANGTKIRKCCIKDYIHNGTECTPSTGFTLSDDISNSTQAFGFPECKESKYISEMFNKSSFDAVTNKISLESGPKLEWHDVCLEHVIEHDNVANLKVFTCADKLSELSHTDVRLILFPIGLLISVVFLLATLATRYVLPSLSHHKLHWRCQTFYVTCLLIGDLLLALIQLFGRNAEGFACVSIGICMHFFFLSAFFWLNTMCFNIYWTFRDFRPTSLERSQEKTRLRFYKVYALGVPFVISATAATIDHMQKNSLQENTNHHQQLCHTEFWFSGNLEKLALFYGPVGALLFVNLALFAVTYFQLTCGFWRRDEVKATNKNERTTLGRICIKLVVVMGVTWIADVLSWAHGVWFGGPYYLWIVTDLINALHGVFIFMVIGCQPQVSSVMKQIWRSKNIQFKRRNTARDRQNSSSSQVASTLGECTNDTLTTNAKFSAETAC